MIIRTRHLKIQLAFVLVLVSEALHKDGNNVRADIALWGIECGLVCASSPKTNRAQQHNRIFNLGEKRLRGVVKYGLGLSCRPEAGNVSVRGEVVITSRAIRFPLQLLYSVVVVQKQP